MDISWGPFDIFVEGTLLDRKQSILHACKQLDICILADIYDNRLSQLGLWFSDWILKTIKTIALIDLHV